MLRGVEQARYIFKMLQKGDGERPRLHPGNNFTKELESLLNAKRESRDFHTLRPAINSVDLKGREEICFSI